VKGLVVGGGSIGRRHLENLKALGYDQLGVVEIDGPRRDRLVVELGIQGFPDLERGLLWGPSYVIVATPPHLHVLQAWEVAKRGFDFFIEKPLSHNWDGVETLCETVAQKKLITLVGCNMRFHPGPAKVRELLDQGAVGKVLFARLYVGSYLPEWRPGTDYATNYGAWEDTGGGCILDCIHEIDLARWYLGEVETVMAMAGHISSLVIETEDVAAVVCRHAGGALSEIHMDYVQRTYDRGCQIVGEQGTIWWDWVSQEVRWFNVADQEWTKFPAREGWQANQMYVDELKHFLECARERKRTFLPVSEAGAALRIALAAKLSAKQGRLVQLGGETGA
jgi:predicted dehydrogenase